MEWISGFENIVRLHPLLALPIAFAAGFMTSFTPCTYPILPITVAFIGSKAGGKRARAFILSLVYVLGIAIVYSTLGAVAAMTGQMFGSITLRPWVFLFVGNACLLFALVMLEVLPLRPPTWFQPVQIRELAVHELLLSLVFGGLSALVVTPCTTPVLGVMLALVAAGQNILLGMVLLFLFAYGMGTLVIIVGTFTGAVTAMPKCGLWMRKIQKGFAVLMLLIAEFFFIKAGGLWI